MRAVVYKGPFEVAVENVPDPEIKHPNDVIVKITSSCICGSDLHMYEGRTAAQPGIVFGHENLGIIQETGPAVRTLKQGDRVVMPFNVACGFCKNCQRGFTGFCNTVNPGFAGGAYGYVAMGPWVGGQAEYLQVPFADFNCLPLPAGTEWESDFAMLADIFPTGYHGAELADVSPGESVAVFGAGPVGLMAAYSCMIRGAAEVYVIDHVIERLQKAEEIGAIPIDFDNGDPVEQIKDRRGGQGVDKGIDAVGYQAVTAGSSAVGGEQDEAPNIVLNQVIDVVNPTGALGIPGLYVPTDPGGVDENSKRGALSINFGRLFEKGLRLGTGQCNVKSYNSYLRDMIISGRAAPSFVVSHTVSLDEAPDAYRKFDQRIDGYTKVILNP
ncbi:MAG: aldehyde dehydrogenase [Chloroflexi bacterium]|jgi:glutathione-independent formaldehyde dehydrogenase|nr:glutathione-independent formaldehyde dehydrogenase [Dehalococcoidia bacterium]PKB75703.1 MAG: aldehyde dehydrogenase [SAR202 cluster bacterium MP-SAtl-SRR3965592-G1]PKB85197.1 MAG: aldehyde dehydrogenase [SAR202 cluster bacterium MP-NPac-SRR3961935-G1]RUA20478.1 MAG: aldehyde dehydrogenase [Chloroflexota bacterium]RUA29894.1 MAG: aldehyde dehydrogenase [Chloroflexota bacterium]|tara:strand:- start:25 stop:1176 length:1152 start_codon:yes stop_codon:yes gene_type:complete